MRFFYEDVYSEWQRCCVQVGHSISSRINISLDVEPSEAETDKGESSQTERAQDKRKRHILGKGGIRDLEVGYGALKGYVEKSVFLLAEGESVKCAVCSENIGLESMTTLVCSHEDCRTAFHMTCLGARFLDDEDQGSLLVPTTGKCPCCKKALQWVDLVKEMSLRARGEKEVTQLMKKPRRRTATKTKSISTGAVTEVIVEESDNAYDLGSDGPTVDDAMDLGVSLDDALPDDWCYRDDDDDMSVTTTTSMFSDMVDVLSPSKVSTANPTLKTVIEDSDWDEAEVLE